MLGRAGEALAERELEHLGYEVVERDVRLPMGQIDLIARERGEWVVVEVKTRSGPSQGLAVESLTWDKRRRLARLGEGWLQKQGRSGEPWRVDVVALQVDRGGEVRSCQVIRNALA